MPLTILESKPNYNLINQKKSKLIKYQLCIESLIVKSNIMQYFILKIIYTTKIKKENLNKYLFYLFN